MALYDHFETFGKYGGVHSGSNFPNQVVMFKALGLFGPFHFGHYYFLKSGHDHISRQ
jgi:hypothetical protein